MKNLLIISFIIIISAQITAQPKKFSTILYGAAYYHEYMPYDRLEKDVQLMQEAGLSVVRLGESTWSLFEPEEGRFEFSWIAKKHPELFVERLDGTKSSYGIRQNFDITNPTYLL